MRPSVLALLIAVAAPLASRAQTPYLVKDINVSTSLDAGSSFPSGFFRYGDRIVFAATVRGNDSELWITDETQAGTVRVADIYPGQQSSSPSRFAEVNGTLVFNARDTRGDELWMSDGTAAGTRQLADISEGFSSSSPGDRIVDGGQMLFSATDGVRGRELWITDGRQGGTRLLKDLNPGAGGSAPRSFVKFNGAVYFSANGLWKTDGTESGTVQVLPVSAENLVVAGSRLYFAGRTEAAGGELWVSDGTPAGTRMVADVRPGELGVISALTAFGDRVLFFADDGEHGREIWISDGTAAGTRLVRDIYPGPQDSIATVGMAVIGSEAVFGATTPETGEEPWKTDGTEAGTVLIEDLTPGSGGSSLRSLTTVGSRVFFASFAGGPGVYAWVTDGTADGTHTVRVSEPRPTLAFSNQEFTDIDGTAYFAGSNGLNGHEPWKSDGTDAGTRMIANVVNDRGPSSDPQNLTAAGDRVYFDAWDGLDRSPLGMIERSLWVSDGTEGGTRELTSVPQPLYTPVGSSLFFRKANDGTWLTDGTSEGTGPATEFLSRFPEGEGSVSYVHGDTLLVFFRGDLWATKLAPGSPAVMLSPYTGYAFADLAGRVIYFSRSEELGGSGIISTDGTPEGTHLVIAGLPAAPYYPTSLGVFRGEVYFGSGELWKTDGTAAGTVRVATLPESPGVMNDFVVAGDRLFFRLGRDLWVTDGTESGTRKLPASLATSIVAAGDRIVFGAGEPELDTELWVSDGTPEGTRLLRDILPGSGSFIGNLTSTGDVAYFSALDEAHGLELWRTDGTEEGTQLVADIEPGPVGTLLSDLTWAGDRLFFVAGPTATGRELWALDLSSTPRLTVADVRTAEGDSGTRNARFTVTLSAPVAQTVTVEYATTDGKATAGSDYDTASGTLTFAPGETSRSVDVTVRGDTMLETNETFFLTLRNASGAGLGKSSGFALIEDDDVTADLALRLDFSELAFNTVRLFARNLGPGTATNVEALITETPHDVNAVCLRCPLVQIAPGAEVEVTQLRRLVGPSYYSASVTARERDPQPSNNHAGWLMNSRIAMDALFLTTGSEANVWIGYPSPGSLSVESSDPAILSVPSSVALPADGKPATFIVRGLAPGRATIRASRGAVTVAILDVEVAGPNTTPRWTGAINIDPAGNLVRFDQVFGLGVEARGTAPFSGATATGVVTILLNGQEVARGTLTASAPRLDVPLYPTVIGTNTYTVHYAGDANFLPQTVTDVFLANKGLVDLSGSSDRNGSTATIRIRVTGSPVASPTGTIRIEEPGVIPAVQAPLIPTTNGVSEAEVTLTNLPPGARTLVITYSGDTRYEPATQNLRVAERRRAVRH